MAERERGMDLLRKGQCPIGAQGPIACMPCPYGHMLECHYPHTCWEAECLHYWQEMQKMPEIWTEADGQ